MSANDCGKCGANLKPGAKFCASCGASVQNQPDQAAAPLYQNPAQQRIEQSPAPQMQSAAPQVGQPADSVSPGEEIAFHIDSQMIQENTVSTQPIFIELKEKRYVTLNCTVWCVQRKNTLMANELVLNWLRNTSGVSLYFSAAATRRSLKTAS